MLVHYVELLRSSSFFVRRRSLVCFFSRVFFISYMSVIRIGLILASGVFGDVVFSNFSYFAR